MRTYSALEIGEFSAVGNGHVLATRANSPGTIELGAKFQTVMMFEMWEALQNGQLIGFFFHSAYTVENKGGYLITFMESKRGAATTSNLVIRNDQDGLIVFDYEGCGSLAISTKVSAFVHSILDTQ